MERDRKENEEEYSSEEFLRLQKAGVLMQGFFTLGFLYFTYVVFMRPYLDFWTNFISIYLMIMLAIGLLYALKPIKKKLNIRVEKSEK